MADRRQELFYTMKDALVKHTMELEAEVERLTKLWTGFHKALHDIVYDYSLDSKGMVKRAEKALYQKAP